MSPLNIEQKEDDISPTHSHILSVIKEHSPRTEGNDLPEGREKVRDEREVEEIQPWKHFCGEAETADEPSSVLSTVTTDELSDSKIGRK